jgi:hypothetical protein
MAAAITSSRSPPPIDYPPNRRLLLCLQAGPGRLSEDQLSPLFETTIEATEEAIDNSVLRETTVHGRDGHVAEAIPIDRLREVMKKYGR